MKGSGTQNEQGEGSGRGRDEGRGEQAVAHEVAVDGGGATASLGDRPHDEALAAAHVAGDEDAGNVRGPVGAGDVAPRRDVDAELLEQSRTLRTDEAHGEEHQLALELRIGAFDLHELPVDHLDLVVPEAAEVAVVVAEEALGV